MDYHITPTAENDFADGVVVNDQGEWLGEWDGEQVMPYSEDGDYIAAPEGWEALIVPA